MHVTPKIYCRTNHSFTNWLTTKFLMQTFPINTGLKQPECLTQLLHTRPPYHIQCSFSQTRLIIDAFTTRYTQVDFSTSEHASRYFSPQLCRDWLSVGSWVCGLVWIEMAKDFCPCAKVPQCLSIWVLEAFAQWSCNIPIHTAPA